MRSVADLEIDSMGLTLFQNREITAKKVADLEIHSLFQNRVFFIENHSKKKRTLSTLVVHFFCSDHSNNLTKGSQHYIGLCLMYRKIAGHVQGWLLGNSRPHTQGPVNEVYHKSPSTDNYTHRTYTYTQETPFTFSSWVLPNIISFYQHLIELTHWC